MERGRKEQHWDKQGRYARGLFLFLPKFSFRFPYSFGNIFQSRVERINLDADNGNVTIIVSHKVLKKEVTPPIYMTFTVIFSRDYFVEEEGENAGWIIVDFNLTQFEKLEDQVFK